MKRWSAALAAMALLLGVGVQTAGAYSVLSHEEVVDMAWKDTIVPMLRARYPGITPDDIVQAHAYAYGGSVIQDIGYYPFGSHYFSDLLHYVRPEDFVRALIRDSKTPNEYAFALGALAHYTGDIIGHPAINQVTAEQNPELEQKYGRVVTYAESPTAHLRTEFGFDVVEVAQGHYTQENYRDFIGFQVAKPLLEQAFQETYGRPMSDVIAHEDLAIGSYRKAVSTVIPKMTVVAFTSYKNEIQAAAPGTEKNKFIYRLNRTEYQKDYGTDYTHLSFGGRVLAFFLRLMPKVGPFKALKVSIPNPQEQDTYLKSMNSTVDRYKLYLGEIHAPPAPLPPPDPKDAADARAAADKLAKDAAKTSADAAKANGPDKAVKEKAAAHVNVVAGEIGAAADRKEAAVASGEAAGANDPKALPPDAPVLPPSAPKLPQLDLDTGRPSSVGEYKLADKTYAQLLHDLVTAKPAPAGAAAGPIAAVGVDPALAQKIEGFYAHPVARTGPAPSGKEAAEEEATAARVKVDLAALRGMEGVSHSSR